MAPARISPPLTPTKEQTNGNGVHHTPSSSAVAYRTKSYSFRSSSRITDTAGDSSMYYIRNTAQSLEKKGTAELGYGVFESVSQTTFIQLVEYIGNERLTSLPHRGSTWDKVLIRALYFAERNHQFEKMIRSFGGSEDSNATNLAYGYVRLLLELSHENGSALDKAFAVLYKHALDVAALQQRLEVVTTTSQIQEELALMYGDLLTLTSIVATRFYKVANGVASANMSLDIYEVASSVIESFRERQEKVIELIWHHQAQSDGMDMSKSISAKALKAWLVSMDPVQTTLTTDHTVLLAGQAEYTNLWFQKPLTQFVQSESKVMAVTGHQGCGKSVLAASVVERLQRSLGRKNFSTLYYAIDADLPASSTTISILKSLLAQIFNLRIGNMQTYRAIVRAYENCYVCTDLKAYEEHLWEALDQAFKKPLDNARDLVVVVDGLDDIHGGKTVAQGFFERLAETVCDGKKLKLIGLGETLSMPSGINTTHISITRDNVQEDIHSVTLKALARSEHLKHKEGHQQEYLLDRIARTANGSFVWAILVSQLLVQAKTTDEFNKTLEEVEKSKPSVSDLVLRILTRHELPAMTRTLIGWIVHAERPLTVYDLQKLFAHGPKHGHDHDIDVDAALEPLRTVLIESEYITRFRHRSILTSVSGLVTSGKITIPDDTKHADILIRGLRYAKSVLRDDPEPTLEEYDLHVVERTLREHSLLSYIVRYWTVHLHRIGTKQHPKELSSALPTTTMMSIIERTIWTHEIPLVQTPDFYKVASEVRQTHLKDPSPAALQSTINLALVYHTLDKLTEAAPLYYYATKTAHRLSHDVLSTELSHRYLHVTEGFTDTKRTEIMTRREEIYTILITLLIKEFGVSSQEVVTIRTTLARFYEHIGEKERAAAVYEKIHEATVHIHGHDSEQARGVSEHLRVKLGRTKTEDKIATRKDSIFDEMDEIEAERAIDTNNISERLKVADSEREFVELWQQVSGIARTTTAVEWHESNIEVAMAYAKFLQTQKRSSEAAAVLTSVTREYETHQASFSDRVVSRLSESAGFLREMGQYTAALSILTATAYFFESVKKTESHQSTEIRRQISTVQTELIQTSSTETHGDVMERVFRAAIKDHSKPVDIKLMTLGKTLTAQYMDRFKPAHAIEIITLLLTRVWPSFLSAPTKEVTLTNTFPKETIEIIVDYLVPAYTQLRQPTNAERSLSTLFNAVLTTKTVDFALVNRIQVLLLEHYDRYNLPERAISTLQRALPVRRAHLGTSHDDTIKTLYELGRRSRQRPRIYPGWIDHYQQIVTYLNKDSETSNPVAMDALVIVATTYWEDGRYDDAVYYYKILWNTFTKQPKQHPRFSQQDFVTQLYERYYTCLEQTSVRVETLYQVTKQYRTTCVTIFGAQSEVTSRATLSLARVSYLSDEHAAEALVLYEEVSKHSTVSVHKSEIQTALSTLYTREITQTSTATSAETIESARARSYSEYSTSASKYGYSHQSTLSQLHQVALLYFKQNKTESATKELSKATTEVITKETSSRKLIEAAESIFATFSAIKATSYVEKLVAELHRQIVRKDTTNTKSWGFDLSKHGRASLPFLTALMIKLSNDTTISFSQTMANLITEMLYFEEYQRVVKSNEGLQDILMSASSLRIFLVRINRQDAVNHLDNEIASIFVARDGGRMKLVSKSSARIFMVAIMEYLGTHKNPNFIKTVVLASNGEVSKLMAMEKYAEAYDIANCAFEFALENDGYSGPKGIGYGFNLASNLAGIGYGKKCSDANLRKQMLQLSNSIARKILDVCKHQDIKFTEIQMKELNRLVELLGVQEDYEMLEWLLSGLWASREAHRDWEATTLHNLGRDLICARYLAGHQIKALRLCEDVAYNLRRTNGASSPVTREMNTLLAELYTGTGQHYLQHGAKDKTNLDLAHQYFSKALAVHEEMLRLLVNDKAGGSLAGDDDDWDSTGAILAEHGITLNKMPTNGHTVADEATVAKTHLRLLKLAYQRLGAWPAGSHQEYERLVHQVQEHFSGAKEVQTPDKWVLKGYGSGKAESNEGSFGKVENWYLIEV